MRTAYVCAVIETRQLLMVKAIAESGTVTRAANRLNLTQPALSHALRDLEDRLGVRLFLRRQRHMEPTPAGQRLLECAAVVLVELESAERAIAEHSEGQRGVVHLATGCYTCYHWLPGLLSDFRVSHPNVDVRIDPDVTYSVDRALVEGRIDLAVVPSPVDDPRIVQEALFEDELVAAVAPDHAWTRCRFVSAGDFAEIELILHVPPAQSDFVVRVLRPAGVEPRRLLQLRLTEAVIGAARAGLGVTVLPAWVIAPEVAAGRLVPVRITPRGLRRQWSVAIRRDRRELPAVAQLLRLLHAGAEPALATCVAPPAQAEGLAPFS